MDHDANSDLLETKHVGMTDQIGDAPRLDDANHKFTPAGSTPLVKGKDGAPVHGSFNYSSVVDMLLYLSGHTHPDIVFALNCCARYMFCPKRSHGEVLKRI